MGIGSKIKAKVSSLFKKKSEPATTPQYSTPATFQGPVKPGTDEKTFRSTGKSVPVRNLRSGGGGSSSRAGTTGLGTTEAEEAANASLNPEIRNAPVTDVRSGKLQAINPQKAQASNLNYSAPAQGPVPTGADEATFRATGQTVGARIPTSTEQQLNMSLDQGIRDQAPEFVQVRQSVDLYGQLLKKDYVTVGSATYEYAGGSSLRDGSSNLIYSGGFDSPYAYGQTPKTPTQEYFATFKDIGKETFTPKGIAVGVGFVALAAVAPISAAIVGTGLAGYTLYQTVRNPTPTNLAYSTIAVLPYAGSKAAGFAYQGASSFLKLPRASSVILGQTTKVTQTEAGLASEAYAVVLTKQKSLVSSKQYISTVKTSSYTQFYNDNFFVSRTGSIGVTAPVTKAGVQSSGAYRFGSLSQGFGSSVRSSTSDQAVFVATGSSKTKVLGKPGSQYNFGLTQGISTTEQTIFTGTTRQIAKVKNPYTSTKLARGNRGDYAGLIRNKDAFSSEEYYTTIGKSSTSQRAVTRTTTETAIVQAAQGSIIQTRTNFVKVSTVPTAVGIQQSAYYGKGLYERTDFVNYGVVQQTPISRRANQSVSYVALGSTVITQQSLVSTPTARSKNRTGPRYNEFVLITQSQSVISRTALRTGTQNRLQPRNRLLNGPYYNFPTYGQPPLPPLPRFSYDELALNSQPVRGGRKKSAYVPSYSALVFGIYGRRKKGGYETGFNFRPIPVNYRFG